MTKNRKGDLIHFYYLLDRLSEKTGGTFLLPDYKSQTNLPTRGVYFFMELGEIRTDTGSGNRIVRVGTHALKPGAKSTLRQRLSAHKGTASGSGNHRGSIFRLLLGTTIISNYPACGTWGEGSTASRDIRIRENAIEKEVSSILSNMPFLYLNVDDAPSPNSSRGFIERNAIALLSNFQKQHVDPPSSAWRGHCCNREKVRLSGLWNQNHVNEDYDPAFLQRLEALVEEMSALT
jgi:hypothetical protein